MNIQDVITLVGFSITLVALFIQGIITLNINRKTSALQVDVNRLGVQLGHKIKQLDRVVEIVRDLHQLMYGESHTRTLDPKEEKAINTHRIELVALAIVLGDTKLRSLVNKLFEHIDTSWEAESDSSFDKWKKTQLQISGASQNVCQRAFELMKLSLESDT